jgi:PAS domain S-box-containing protein
MGENQRFDETAWLAALVESSNEAIISTDLNGIITSWNPAAERIYGYSAGEAIGHSNNIIIPPDRYAEEGETRRLVIAGQPVQRYDSVRVRKDGVRIDISLIVSPLRTKDGRVVGISKISHDASGEKRAEQLFRDVIEATSDAFAAIDGNSRFTYVNERYAEMSRMRRDELVGHVVWDVFPEAKKLRVFDEVRRVMRDRSPATVEEYYPPLDLWFRTRIFPTRDGVATFTTDVSERKRADRVKDESLEAARELAAIVTSTDDAIIALDVSGRIRAWNRAAERMYGYTADAAVGQSIEITLPRERQPEESAFLDRIMRGERIVAFETVRCRKDGSCFPVSLTMSPVYDEHGVVIGASKIARDISERKRAAERAAFLTEAGTVLAGSLEYATTLKAVANLAVPAIADWCAVDILTDEHKLERLAVAHVDPAKIDLARTVRSRYEDPNSPLSPTHVVRTGAPAILKEIPDETVIASAQGDEERIALIRSLGVRSYMIVPLTAHGRTFGTLTFATAQAGRVYDDEDFRFAQDVAFRAALAVDNARAYQDAQTANQLKDEFLATLSHELRTPLNAILGYTRLLRSGMIGSDRQSHALVTVERNASALTQIVEDILDVSRIISGKIRLNIQPVDVSQVVKDAVETMTLAADVKQIRIQTILDPRAGPISGDPDRLQQIVWNLVSNAVKFTPKQGIVQVRLERINSHVEIVVSDTGIGIAPDFLPHIFERFRQADSGTTRAHGGIGLGLAIVRRLVELHGGTIHVASGGRDQGTTFRVRLPLMVVHPQDSYERRTHAPGAAPDVSGALPRLDGLRILAVDDDADARALVTETLEAAGASVTTVDSAARGVDALAAGHPDVLLADIGMVESDGFELIRRVRASDDLRVRHVPAAALTAYARAEDRMKALRAGFQMHLSKPVDPAELIIAVAALAKQRRRASE